MSAGTSARWFPPMVESDRSGPCTSASIDEAESLNRSPATWSMVVERMKVPAMKPTPRTMARTVDSKRRLCAHIERRVTRRTR